MLFVDWKSFSPCVQAGTPSRLKFCSFNVPLSNASQGIFTLHPDKGGQAEGGPEELIAITSSPSLVDPNALPTYHRGPTFSI